MEEKLGDPYRAYKAQIADEDYQVFVSDRGSVGFFVTNCFFAAKT